jgi:hypothetical protein
MNDGSFRFLAQHYFPVKVYLANFSSLQFRLRAGGHWLMTDAGIPFNGLT